MLKATDASSFGHRTAPPTLSSLYLCGRNVAGVQKMQGTTNLFVNLPGGGCGRWKRGGGEVFESGLKCWQRPSRSCLWPRKSCIKSTTFSGLVMWKLLSPKCSSCLHFFPLPSTRRSITRGTWVKRRENTQAGQGRNGQITLGNKLARFS